MELGNFIEGLKTLQQYYKNGNGHHISAGHKEIYAFPTERPLTPDDVQKMRDLGWFQSEREGDEEYDPNESWIAFT